MSQLKSGLYVVIVMAGLTLAQDGYRQDTGRHIVSACSLSTVLKLVSRQPTTNLADHT